MEQVWQMISRWDRLGQFIFFVFLAFGCFATIELFLKYFAILFRGWPEPQKCVESADSDDSESVDESAPQETK